MMRDEEDSDASSSAGGEKNFDGPASTKKFDSKIEEDLGYEIQDEDVRLKIAHEVYSPKPKLEFGYDPSVVARLGGNALMEAPKDLATPVNIGLGGLPKPGEDDAPTNLLANKMGYVMPDMDGPEEGATLFGEEQLILDDDDDEDEPPPPKKGGGGGHKPYSALQPVKESSKEGKYDKKQKQQHDHMDASHQTLAYEAEELNNILVSVRWRPMTEDELVSKKKKKSADTEHFWAWKVEEDDEDDTWRIIEKKAGRKIDGKNQFHVDHVFLETDKTLHIYEDVVKPVIKAGMSGRHGTVFAYGQAGAGKTFTMQGGSGQEGIIQAATKDLFKRINRDREREYIVKACYMEIYNEEVRDLMGFAEDEADVKSRRATAVVTAVNKLNIDLPALTLRDDTTGTGDVIVNAQMTEVTNLSGVIRVLHKGNRNRATEKTKKNEFSSRSHSVFRLTIESHEKLDEGLEDMEGGLKVRVGVINFVDLAGDDTKSKSKKKKEPVNQSLHSLTQVIHQLSLPPKKRPAVIDFSESKLTRLLQPHLQGNAAISILCCATPSKKFVDETRMTLKFAYNAKQIELHAMVNEIFDDQVLVENLKRELHETRVALKELKDNHKNAPPTPAPHYPPPQYTSSAKSQASHDSDEFFDAASNHSDMGGAGLADDDDGPSGGDEEVENEGGGGDDDDDVDAFRQQILAKLMAGGDFSDEEDEEADDSYEPTEEPPDREPMKVVEPPKKVAEPPRKVAEPPKKVAEPPKKAVQPPKKAEEPPKRQAAPVKAPVEEASEPEESSEEESSEEESSEDEEDEDDEDEQEGKPEEVAANEAVHMEKRVENSAEDEHSNSDLVDKFRAEILEKFSDEIVDDEAAHELEENAENVAVIANELIAKFKREIVLKYMDEFPELMGARFDVSVEKVGAGIVGRLIEPGLKQQPTLDATTDDDTPRSVEQFEDEFDEEPPKKIAQASPRREKPERSQSAQTDQRVINGKVVGRGGFEMRSGSGETDPSTIEIQESVGGSGNASVNSDLSSDVKDRNGKKQTGKAEVQKQVHVAGVGAIPPGEVVFVKEPRSASAEDAQLRAKFLEEKLEATDELVESLFAELENAKGFIRELVYENSGANDTKGSFLFGKAGASGVTVVDEVILRQCEILKFAIYVSLLFFLFGQHELFLASVFFLWLSLEVATKS